MQASFIIPLYNCLDLTRECLSTLQATLPAGLAHEIILVDDGSTDGTRDWLATLAVPCRAVLNERNLGFAGTCNRGAATARGAQLFFLNNDLVFLPGWFEPMSALLTRARAGLVGNVQRRVADGALDHAGIRFDEKGKPVHDLRRPPLARLIGAREVPAVTGACFGLRRTVWEQLGGFDPAYRNGGEDVDLALRARAVGLANFVSLRSVVRHHVSASLGRKLRDEENSFLLARRWREATVPLAAAAWSRLYLSTHWEEPRDFDGALARSALRQVLLPHSTPATGVRLGTQAALNHEFERWRQLLDPSAPKMPPLRRRETAHRRTDQI